MKTTIQTLFVIAIIFPLCAFGQQGIFEYVEERAAHLTAEQIELLEKLPSKPQVVTFRLVEITDVEAIGNSEQLLLNLPDEIILTVGRTFKITLQREQVRWNGSFTNNDPEVSLLISRDGMTGMIRSQVHNYDIHPLRNSGLHVLVEIDPSEFDREEQPLMIDGIDDTNSIENDLNNGSTTLMSDPEIRVMVVYTTNAKNNYIGNIDQMITLAVGNMEDAFTTSGVNADVNLVHTAEISYSENSNSILNLCRLTMSKTFDPRDDSLSNNCDHFSTAMISGYMGQIHEWRYQYNAHLVVLITGSGGAGVAWTPAVNTNYAFSIARYDVAASDYTLAHEIGHNLGAHHDPDNAEVPVYPYGHGYIYQPAQWTTIMAYPLSQPF